MELRIPETVVRVTAFPQEEELEFVQSADKVMLTVPKFTMHTVLVLEYSAQQA